MRESNRTAETGLRSRSASLWAAWVAILPMIAGAPALASTAAQHETRDDFDVVIAGGTTAALAAAASAVDSGARVCLLEPTDWPGGQLTASGVPAVDEAWHRVVDPKSRRVVVDVARIARRRENMTPNFRAMLDATGNPGHGWVSNYCFEPVSFLASQLRPLEDRLGKTGRLVVYREAVVKRVEADAEAGLIRSIVAIRRTPRPGVTWGGYDRLPSEDIPDWYNPAPSDRFDKTELTIKSRGDGHTVFLDATEWGEVLVLSGAPYLQGIDAREGGNQGDDTCGQSIVFCFVERLNGSPADEPRGPSEVPGLGFGDYTGRPDAWDKIWTYRRIRSRPEGGPPAVGDLCLQNWGYSARRQEGGNDYPFGYLFLPRAKAEGEREDWRGGVDLKVMAAAEARAFGWHRWFRDHAPANRFLPGQVTLERGALGTGHGLAKLPYIRDTRRSVGLDGFLLTIDDLCGPIGQTTGRTFPDRIALGAYPADIHPLSSCSLPGYVKAHRETLPFCIPFRALTNRRYGNLLVAGKTMAQSFLANSATRLHPIEWSTGTAAGVAAAEMARAGRTSRQELGRIEELRDLVRRWTPVDWVLEPSED